MVIDEHVKPGTPAWDVCVGPNATFLYELETETWEEAMAEHHKRQGWEPYVPMKERT